MPTSSAEKPKGPSIEGLSKKAPESAGDRTKRFQSMEKISGKMEDFGEELSVEVAMGKDMEKRPGSERGEDMYLADKETGLTGVFDGLGGEGNGADASGMAAQFAPSLYKVMRKSTEQARDLGAEMRAVIDGQGSFEHPDDVAKFIEGLAKLWEALDPALKQEVVALFKTVQKLGEKVAETGGMTTVTLGRTVSLPDGRMFEVIANIGDSGAMKIDAEGNAADVTKEDSTVDQAISMGMLTREQAADPNHLVKVGSKEVPVSKLRRGMYQALGMKGQVPVPRMSIVEIKPGDKMVYATDGIRDEISDEYGNFDAKKAAAAMGEGGAELLMREAEKGTKKDEKTVLIKERFATAEVLEELAEDEVELDEGDIIEAA
jgi:serine/threonine protein phosphatase PrpC